MADGYLESRQQDYEARKEAFLRQKKYLPKVHRQLQRPEDEAL